MEFEFGITETDKQSVKMIENVIGSALSLTNAKICIYDLKNFFESHSLLAIKNNLKWHYCDFCIRIKKLPGGQEACDNSDRVEVLNQAMEYRRPFFYTCHAGLNQLIIPIIYQENLIATVFIGQCRIDSKQDNFNLVWSRLKGLGANQEELSALYNKMPIVRRSELLAVGMLIDHSLHNIAGLKGRKTFEQFFSETEKDYVYEAAKYIESHYMETLSTKDIAKFLHLNPSYLARLFKKKMRHCICDYIIQIRIEKARDLLSDTDLPISNIAVNVGYMDYTYFYKKFVKVVGYSPGKYRKIARNFKFF